MGLDDYKKYAPAVLRYGIGLLLLWFGLTNVSNPSYLARYLPSWFSSFGINSLIFMRFNGAFEIIIAVALIVGLFTRAAALLAFLHIAGIGLSLGYNDIGIRDIGLSIASLSIFFNGPDILTLDKKYGKRT